MGSFQYLKSELDKIHDYQTERSFYAILKQFLINFAKEDLNLKNETNVICEASSTVHESKVGFPDLTVLTKSWDFQTIGWVEVKLPKDNLSDQKFQAQFHRYTDSLENVIFTNLREWQLYQWDEKGKSKKVTECLYDATSDNANTANLTELLEKFFNRKALDIRTPKQLALALARKTRLLSKEIEDELAEEDPSNDFKQLKTAFARTLIPNLENHQFANMAAETIAYSFFLAALEHTKEEKTEFLTFRTAIDYLPKSIPVLTDLYELVGKAVSKNESIKFTMDAIIEQFRKADMKKIYKDLTHHKEDQDPTIYFYENFLAEYDPKVREERGVYYTPKYVVNYIVKSIDEILTKKLGKIAGIDDPDVHLLDPATGTGTFLMLAIELIEKKKRRQFGSLGEEIVKREFIRVAKNHILKRFFGFELMIAPYAIAHLKLTMLLEELGFDFAMTKNDGDSDNDRLKIYLANTLEPPEVIHKGQLDIFDAYKSISDESEKASRVKAEEPILVIMGNPPYSGISSNMNAWIDGLLKGSHKRKNGSFNEGYYKVDGHDLGEKKLWLQDDYVKFIRFAQWKIDQMDEGIVGFITNHGFLDNPTFRGMRQSLMNSFNEIYILNLHGNSLKKEKTPDGNKDENVFAIQTGVCITLFIKTKEKKSTEVYSADIWGTEKTKEDYLKSNTLASTKWQKLSPKSPYYFFVQKNTEHDEEYESFTKVTEIFTKNCVGIVTARDALTIQWSKDIVEKTVNQLAKMDVEEARRVFDLGKDASHWSIASAQEDLVKSGLDEKNIVPVEYRPFDTRFTYYTGKSGGFQSRPMKEVMQHMLNHNFGLVSCRQVKSGEFNHAFISSTIIESCLISNKTGEINSIFPLDLNETESNMTQNFVEKIHANLSNESSDQHQIFDYIYGTLYLPSYRKKYAEQLKTDFPRIPLPSQILEAGLLNKDHTPAQVFDELSNFGRDLRELHLLTHPIFEDTSKWNVKIGGQKVDNTEDWKVNLVKYNPTEQRIYVNKGQYFEGIEPQVWAYYIGGYQILDKWLKDRKKADRCLSSDDLIHYCKVIASLRETIRLVQSFK